MLNNSDKQEVEVLEYATTAETEEAIYNLTDLEHKKLYYYAYSRIDRFSNIGGITKNYTPIDLVREAITRVLREDRRWKKDAVNMYKLLRDTIRSITSNWQASADANDHVIKVDEICCDDEGENLNPVENTDASTPTPVENLEAKQKVEKINSLFADDKLVLDIIDGLYAGLKGPEIQQILEITEKEYDTAKRRLNRKREEILKD